MKAQTLTKAMLKANACFWKASVDTDPDTGKSTVKIEEWRVRSVLNRRPSEGLEPVPTAFFVKKVDGSTWVKLSPRKGDYGWASAIRGIDKATCHLGCPLPDGMATTKYRACERAKILHHESRESLAKSLIRFGHSSPDDDPEYMAEMANEVAALDRAAAYWKTREKAV